MLRWIGGTRLSALHLRPIRIRAGALGAGLPAADLLVSRQHRVLVRSAIARRMFDAPEVRVAAKHLLTLEGIDIATDQAQVAYFHLLFDRHELVISNGAEEQRSLYAGAEALASLGRAEMEEIFALMPALRDPALRPEAARPLSGGTRVAHWPRATPGTNPAGGRSRALKRRAGCIARPLLPPCGSVREGLDQLQHRQHPPRAPVTR